MSYIVAQQAVKEFGTGDATVVAVKGIDLSIEQGAFLSIMGNRARAKARSSPCWAAF